MDAVSSGSAETSPGSADTPSIELGFAERVAPTAEAGVAISSSHLPDWDGGKAGGRPVWLHPSGLPPPGELTCQHCSRPLALLTQLYAPVDRPDVDHEDAYHRMLYVFTCTRGDCVNRVQANQPSVVALRCQLPKLNAFHNGTDVFVDPAQASPTCVMCGASAPHRCSRCHGPRYCSRAHQAMHWKAGHKARCGAGSPGTGDVPSEDDCVAGGCVFPEHEIVIEREPSSSRRRRREEASLPQASAAVLKQLTTSAAAGATYTPPPGNNGSGADDDDEEEVDESQLSIDDLTQRTLAETTGARLFSDDTLRYFQRRVAVEPSQVVRYCRWPDPGLSATTQAPGAAGSAATTTADGAVADSEEEELELDADGEPFGAPLWLTSANQPPAPAALPSQPPETSSVAAAAGASAAIPPCPRCGSERRFEFQVMPQLLNYVLAPPGCSSSSSSAAALPSRAAGDLLGPPDGRGCDLDFGTIAVFTCTRSCGSERDEGGPYVREFAWVQPMHEEDSEPQGAGAGGEGGKLTGRGSILHEALRRMQGKERRGGTAPIAEEEEGEDGPD